MHCANQCSQWRKQSSDVPRSVRHVTPKVGRGTFAWNRRVQTRNPPRTPEETALQIICPRTRAEEQHQPRTLQIGDRWDPLRIRPSWTENARLRPVRLRPIRARPDRLWPIGTNGAPYVRGCSCVCSRFSWIFVGGLQIFMDFR